MPKVEAGTQSSSKRDASVDTKDAKKRKSPYKENQATPLQTKQGNNNKDNKQANNSNKQAASQNNNRQTSNKDAKNDNRQTNNKDSQKDGKQAKNKDSKGNKGGKGTQSKMVSSGTQSSARGPRSEPISEDKEEPEEEPQQNEEKEEEKKQKKPERKERVKEFFKTEIQRLKKEMEKEAEKIDKPERKEFTPYTFTSLAPYLDLHSLEFLLNYPDEPDRNYTSRNVSFGLTDPWDDYRLDTDRPDEKKEEKKEEKKKKPKKEKEEKKEDKKEERPPKEGSTRLPKFPVVSIEPTEMANKKISYADVPKLREEIKNKYSKNSDTKVVEEYERTKQDFYRMELDKMEEIHPVNRPHMRAAYFAYLQNNPGSRKAVYECFKQVADKKEGEDDETEEQGSTTNRSRASVKSKSSDKQQAKA